MVVELYTAKQLFGSEVKEFMANTKLKNAHNLINNVFTKNTPINLWIYVGTPPTSSYPPQAIQHSFLSASLPTLDVFYAIYTPRLDTPGNPGYSGWVEYKAV